MFSRLKRTIEVKVDLLPWADGMSVIHSGSELYWFLCHLARDALITVRFLRSSMSGNRNLVLSRAFIFDKP